MERQDSAGLRSTSARVERRQRLRIVLIAVPAMLGLLVFLWTTSQDERFFYEYGLFRKQGYLAVAIALLGLAGVSLVMTYLQTGFKRSGEIEFESELRRADQSAEDAKERESLVEVAKALRGDVDRAAAQLEKALKVTTILGEVDKSALVDDLKVKIEKESASSVLEDIAMTVAATQRRALQKQNYVSSFDESKARLSQERRSLTFRGNLNLALGAVTTVIGLIILGLSDFAKLTQSKDILEFAAHFLPRLSLVLMIEIFAYFFLALYKTSLHEIKYFQNELTNIESKQIALRAALDSGDEEVVADIVASLATTERNHVLLKGQTTLELERIKIDREGQSELVRSLRELLKGK